MKENQLDVMNSQKVSDAKSNLIIMFAILLTAFLAIPVIMFAWLNYVSVITLP